MYEWFVLQVSHQGKPIEGGFSSGAARDNPSAFMFQFQNTGVYYYVRCVIVYCNIYYAGRYYFEIPCMYSESS